MVGQVLRFWEPHRKVREILDSGRIGRPRHLLRRRTGWQKEIRRDWYRKDTEGSMVLYSYAPHEVDIMLWWVRERPARVYAQGLKNNPYWNQDELSVVVTTEQGTILSLSQSLNSRTHQWDQLVIGSEESLYVNGNEIRIGEKEALTVERKSGPAEEVREFVNAILEGRLPEAHGRDVRATMEVLDAAERSMRANQAVELGLVSAARSAPE
ncbi:MAG: Gfo/Idh/MocA family oxidoreductase [Planctomycetota bacterium]|nr:Gfo/Idh/MocA family oxidoreductase [Planctomycetota bacterium]